MNKGRGVLIGVALTAGLLTGPAVPVSASLRGTTEQAHASSTLSFTVVGFGSGPYDAATGEFHTVGAFIATRFGPGLVLVDSDPTAGFTAIETFVRGDRVFITNDPTNPGGALPTYCPTDATSGPYAGGEFITGGTGRFDQARGYITYSGCSSVHADPRSLTGYTFSFTFVDKATMTVPS